MEAFIDYIMELPANVQGSLMDILTFIEEKFPDAEKKMYFGMLGFFRGGYCITMVGAYKKHLSVVVNYELIEAIKAEYPNYSYTKATIQLPHTEPVPFHVLEAICAGIASGSKGVGQM